MQFNYLLFENKEIIMTSFAVAPAPVKKIISSIKKKEIQLLELKSELERKKVKQEFHEFDDFNLNINNFIQDIQRIKKNIAEKGISEDNVHIEYKHYYDDSSVSVYYFRDENDEEYEKRTQPIQVKIKKVQLEIKKFQKELDEMEKFFSQSNNK